MRRGPKRTAWWVRFWSHVHKTDGCWEWTGATVRGGYGQFHVAHGVPLMRAHRVSWAIHFGPPPKGLVVRHRCDNRRCVRPDHLELGTQAQNLVDMFLRGRGAVTP